MSLVQKLIVLISAFISYTFIVNSCPMIDAWDKNFIIAVQSLLQVVPTIIPQLPDKILYIIMIIIPICALGLYFIIKRKWLDVAMLALSPLFCYLFNYFLLKPLVHRARPPYELQLGIHPDSFSYVSTHSLVTFSIWALVIYFAYKYSFPYKKLIATLAALWILFVGFSRIWLGVHHLTDVLGAYILGLVIILSLIKLRNLYEKPSDCL